MLSPVYPTPLHAERPDPEAANYIWAAVDATSSFQVRNQGERACYSYRKVHNSASVLVTATVQEGERAASMLEAAPGTRRYMAAGPSTTTRAWAGSIHLVGAYPQARTSQLVG